MLRAALGLTLALSVSLPAHAEDRRAADWRRHQEENRRWHAVHRPGYVYAPPPVVYAPPPAPLFDVVVPVHIR